MSGKCSIGQKWCRANKSDPSPYYILIFRSLKSMLFLRSSSLIILLVENEKNLLRYPVISNGINNIMLIWKYWVLRQITILIDDYYLFGAGPFGKMRCYSYCISKFGTQRALRFCTAKCIFIAINTVIGHNLRPNVTLVHLYGMLIGFLIGLSCRLIPFITFSCQFKHRIKSISLKIC